jgi:hypothetical protein
MELVIAMALVSLVNPAWDIAHLIAKRYFVSEMSLVYHIKMTFMVLRMESGQLLSTTLQDAIIYHLLVLY